MNPALPALLFLSLAAGERPVLVVERSTLGIPATEGAKQRELVVRALATASLHGATEATTCADRACLVSLARARGAIVVGVTLVKSKKGLTVDLEAVDEKDVVTQETFLLLPREQLDSSPSAQVFAHHLASKLVPDRPVLEPPPQKPPEPLITIDPQPAFVDAKPPRPIAPRVVGITASVVGAAGIGALIAGAVVKGNLDGALAQQPVVTTLTRAQAEQQAGLANGLTVGGAVALGLGVAGGVTAFVLALSDDEGPYY